jgi:hypothetical protein
MGLFKRHQVWWMSFSYQGRQIRRSTGSTDRRLAEAVLAKVKVKLIEGQYFDQLEEHERTLGDMMERYLRERIIGQSRHGERRARAMLEHVLPTFGNTTLARVTPKDLASYKWRRHQEGAAPATIVKELAFMKAAFNVAIREWECAETIRCVGCRWARSIMRGCGTVTMTPLRGFTRRVRHGFSPLSWSHGIPGCAGTTWCPCNGAKSI